MTHRMGFPLFVSLALGTFVHGARGPARLTVRRAFLMAGFLPLLLLVQAVHRAALLLDNLLFPGYRKVTVREPVFVVGVPRSGTTFLHRLLAADDERFTTTALWELVFAPAIVERKLILGVARVDRAAGRPLGRLVAWLEQRAFGGLDAIHGTTLSAPEEDYLGLLPLNLCFILVLAFPFSETLWAMSRFDQDMPERFKRRVLRYYRGIVQRHLYVHGPERQYLSKNPSFTSLVEGLRATFPDCRIVACARTPYAAVPSLVSSMRNGARLFDVDRDGAFFARRLADMACGYYAHLERALPPMGDAHAFVTLDDLGRAPRETVRGLYARFGFAVPDAYDAHLREAEEKARGYSSRHTYSLESTGLDAATLRERLGFVFDRFGFDPHAADPPSEESPLPEKQAG